MGLVGRLCQDKLNPNKKYQVKSFAPNDGEITLRMLFDDYQIMIKTDTQMTICLPTMKCKKFKSNYALLDKAQEIFWKREMLTDNYVFTLKYTIQETWM